MQERKINLEEILKIQVEGMYIFEDVSEKDITSFRKGIYDAMKETARQALELAAENYSNNETFISDNPEYLKQSILNTINQIE